MKTKTLRAYASLGEVAERKLDAKKRTIDVIASTTDEDSHGTVIEQDWILARFEKNPVCLFDHNSGGGIFEGIEADEKLPIGRCEGTRVENNQLKTTIVFPAEGRNELSDKVWMAIEDGRLNATSVGFRKGKVSREVMPDGRERYRLSGCELHEISIVVLPSNPAAVMERSLLARLADRAKMTGCSTDDCIGGPDDCVDIDCPCDCHAGRALTKTTTATAPSASTESTMNLTEVLARMLGCTADEASIVSALEALKVRAAAEPITAELVSAPSFDEERRTLILAVDETKGIVRSLVDSLGLAADAPAADATKAILALQARAVKADELEPMVADLSKRIAEFQDAIAVREVDFLIKRGKQYDLSLDERSRKALLAYRKADAKGFAEDYKPALDGLRAFDESELFERVAAESTSAEPVVPAGDPDAEFEARVSAYATKHNALRSVAIDAVLRGRDLG